LATKLFHIADLRQALSYPIHLERMLEWSIPLTKYDGSIRKW